MASAVLNKITGTIYDINNAPLIRVTVQAYDKDLRSDQLLGQAVTDAKGFYSISYESKKYANSEYLTADVFIRILQDGKVLLGESPVYYNVPSDFKLDFKIGNTPIKPTDEFDALIQKIKPLTDPQKVAIADLQENGKFNDITFLANETGEDASKISLLPIAFTLSGKTRIPPDIFYGLFRLQFPTDLNALLLIKSESITGGIKTAVDENIISEKWNDPKQINSIIQIFNKLAVNAAISGKNDQSAAFKQVIGTALPDQKLQKTFVSVFLNNENTPEKFWDSLSKQSGFNDAKVIEGIQSALKLNLLTNNVPSLTALLYSEQQQNQALKDISGFASFTYDDWHSRIDKLVASGQLKNFPGGITGSTPEEKAVNYAEGMTQLVKSIFPVQVFADRLSKDEGKAFQETKKDLLTFFSCNADFDLKSNNPNKEFDKSNLSGIANKDNLKKELTVINRLYKITVDFERMSSLRQDGIDSATGIVRKYSSAQFAEKFAGTMDDATASAIYQKTLQIDKRATVLAMSLKMRNDIPVYVINGLTNDASPDYESLFGDTNCQCEHCLSVYSPSAYFVDILNILMQYNPDAYNRLIARRPDLIQILLTCENTNTPLPYIDLVNELLENLIAPVPPVVVNGVPTYPQFQTTNSADELAAYPEHVDGDAYSLHLDSANSAYNLPLNLPLEETRLYLDKLSVKRYKLMELFYGKHTGNKYNDINIAAEYLQLSQKELEFVNGTIPMPVTLDKITDFLTNTGLTYIEMLQLMECYFINPPLSETERSIKIVSVTSDQTTCNINDMKFQTANSQSLKVNPFIRLWKKTGWDIFDLDKVFTALGVDNLAGDVNGKLIIPLSHIARLKDRYNISVSDAIVLWSNIDMRVYVDHTQEEQPALPTQYDGLFQNKKITNPVDPSFALPLGLSGNLADKPDVITSALNLLQSDFDTLSKAPFTDGKLKLENLSILFRYKLLAKMLKLSIDDLITAVDLCSVNPFGGSGHSADTLIFADKISIIRSAGYTVSGLNDVLALDIAAIPQIDINSTANVLSSIREGLRNIELLRPVGSTHAEQVKNKLQNQNKFIADTLGTAFKTDAAITNIFINNLVKYTADNTKPAITPFIDAAFISSEGAIFSVDNSGSVTWTFPDLVNTYVLLNNTWTRLSGLMNKLKITNDEFIYFQKNASALNIGDIWNLPASQSGSTMFPGFENLYNIIAFRNALSSAADWYKLFDFAILNNTNAKKGFIDSLIGISGLTQSALELLTGSETDVNDTGFLKFKFPSDFLEGSVLLAVTNCAYTAVNLGSIPDNIAKLTITKPTKTEADNARSVLKSKYDIQTWLNVIKPVSNQLRVRRRDALVSYILTSPDAEMTSFRQNNNISDTNSLYAYFLIDLETDACMMTSRIKQAISSVQLYVDRCLMNLEAGINLSSDFVYQWNSWRSRYRVWEANRKIFLYPENWIEPELRDDKSPFFEDLESKLKQNDITDATATDALLDYLKKLDTVANLEIVAVYPDTLTNIIHVIGRTKNLPHQYYYTKQFNSVWSAWEKVQLDIEGDHIFPVVWNNRLMLFWGIFSEKEENSGGFKVPSSGDIIPPAPKSILINLAWSEYKNGNWSSKKQTKDAVILDSSLKLEKSYISLSPFIDREKLYIRIFFNLGANPDYDFIWNWADQTFVFNNCHDSPVILPQNNSEEGLELKIIERIHDTKLNEMFVGENINKDTFSVLDTGIYKLFAAGENYNETTLFQNTPGNFQILPDHFEIEKAKPSAFFYSNERNIFYVHSREVFVKPVFTDPAVLTQGLLISRISTQPVLPENLNPVLSTVSKLKNSAAIKPAIGNGQIVDPAYPVFPEFFKKHYYFQTFYHPYVCELIKTLNSSGIDGLYKNLILDTDGLYKDGIQNIAGADIFIPNGNYNPTTAVSTPYPVEQVDFNYGSVYSIYNWELFFHIPLLIATRLSQNQKFEDARKWFHFIFDPTRTSSQSDAGAERFWLTKPFKEEIKKGVLSVEEILNNAAGDLDIQLNNWERNPFNPHAVARLRVSAYMRSTIMNYIDNLIAWGDQLFQQDTLETINEATLFYATAANMLGKKPELVPARAVPSQNSFSDIMDKLDSFGNAKVAVQSFFSISDSNSTDGSIDSVMVPLFCLPKNDMLLGYWDIVADRLFKIRHCLNIQGVFQQLPLFEPPINPALLVAAAAAGLDLSNVINDMNAALPNYRFRVLLQKAYDICNDVKGLGSELLSALEKKDAEQLALMRSGHELSMLDAVRDIKVDAVNEANENLNSMNKSRDVVRAKSDYYGSREFINAFEAVYFASIPAAMIFQNMQAASQALGSVGYSAPQVTIGPFSSGATYGGDNLGHALTCAAAHFGQIANILNTSGNLANIFGGYQRRMDDWTFQKQSADLELKQIDKQIAAAEIRLAIAQKELENHDLQKEQSKEVDDFLRNKFTNEELYNYMSEQISFVYFQSYQLAYNTAKKAQKCFEHELGAEGAAFIQFGYWDSLKKGLLAGEKLQYDLRRMENAYLDQNKREYEITKHVSVALLDPLALIKLRSTGSCDFEIPEALYDMDYAGHYFRRIKSVSISLPCIAGPYTPVSAVLLLVGNKYRKNTDADNTAGTGYAEDPGNDERFLYNVGSVQSIAASSAQNDGGVFQLNFNDERFLPFEGAGASSSWHLEFPAEIAQFDYNSISDVIIHLNYTARDGGTGLKNLANAALKNALSLIKQQLGEQGLHIALDMKRDMPNEWHQFKTAGQTEIVIDKSRLPYAVQTSASGIDNVRFIAKVKNNPSGFKININSTALNLAFMDELKLLTGSSSSIELGTSFKLSAASADLPNLEELMLVIKYSF